MKIKYNYQSPNFGPRPEGMFIDTIIIHYTDMKDDISALERLCNKEAQVSSHYLINKQGEIFSLVPDELRAWHAGPSYWHGREKVNDFSIGIELDNNGHEEFSAELMESLIILCKELIKNHPINPLNIIGHSDITPSRKFDPGRFFNWQMLAENEIGIYPQAKQITKMPDLEIIKRMLEEYGYNPGEDLVSMMRAFNEHFNPQCYDWNMQSQAMLEALLDVKAGFSS